jgi:hypothetical protein
MSEGIPAVVRRTNSIHWGDVQRHSIILSTFTSALLLFAASTLVPAYFVTKRLSGILYEIERSAVKTAGSRKQVGVSAVFFCFTLFLAA